MLWRSIAGAVLQLIYTQVAAGESQALEQLLPMSTYMLLVALEDPAAAASAAGLLATG